MRPVKLLALIMAFGLYHYVAKPDVLRSYRWLSELQTFMAARFTETWLQLLLVLFISLAGLAFVVELLFDFQHHSVGYLVVSVLLLYYCLGPRTVAEDIHNQDQQQALGIPAESSSQQVVHALTDVAIHRWFGVFFWYVVLGIYGALAYRVVCAFKHSGPVDEDVSRLLKLLEYPVVVLMTLSLALASDFDRIWQQCKQFLHKETLLALDSQFLYQSMDLAVAQCDIDVQDENKTQITANTTFVVLKRVLVVWLAFVALLVLFSGG